MRVKYGEMEALFEEILVRLGFPEGKAKLAAHVFTDNSCDGVHSHGLNRFPRFISYVAEGHVDPKAEPQLDFAFGPFERWDGKLGVGCTNAVFATDRAIALAQEHGIGCVALRNTNHWMRGGTYGLRAARQGFAAICWTNTMPNVPAWGTKTPNVGNNPLVMAFPWQEGEFLIDGALAQYSYGALDGYRMAGQKLPFPGGYNREGKLTTDPGEILETWRVLPIGFWKGSGYSFLLDMIGAALSQGNTVPDIGRLGEEIGLTQIFMVFNIDKLSGSDYAEEMARGLLGDFRAAEPAEEGQPFYYPGEKEAQARQENLELGIPVNEEIWQQLLTYKVPK